MCHALVFLLQNGIMGNKNSCPWIEIFVLRKNKLVSKDIQCDIDNNEVSTKDIATEVSHHFLKLNQENKSQNCERPLTTDPLNASFVTTRPLISQVIQADVITQTYHDKEKIKYQAELESLSRTIASSDESYLHISGQELSEQEKSDSNKPKSYSRTNFRSKSNNLSQQTFFRGLSNLKRRSALVCSIPDRFETNIDFPSHYSRTSKDSKEDLLSVDNSSKSAKSFDNDDDILNKPNISNSQDDISEEDFLPSIVEAVKNVQTKLPTSPMTLNDETLPHGDIGVRLPYKESKSLSTDSVKSINWPHQRDIISRKITVSQSPKQCSKLDESHVLVNMSSISTKQNNSCNNYKYIDVSHILDHLYSSDDNVCASIVNDKGDQKSYREDYNKMFSQIDPVTTKSFKKTEEVIRNAATEAEIPVRPPRAIKPRRIGEVAINRTPQIYDNRIKGLDRDVKQIFHVYDDHRLLQVLADDKDRRIKAICDKYGCSLVIYAKPPWKGFIRFAITIRAPSKAMMKMCIHALDSAMKWNISSQLK